MIRNVFFAILSINLAICSHVWQHWKVKYGKQYSNGLEEGQRKQIWLDNLDRVLHHNNRHAQNLETYTLEMNHLSDMTPDELSCQYKGRIETENSREYNERLPEFKIPFEDLPSEVDWVKKGHVTSVKNQNTCGSCYAFATIATMEGQYSQKTGQLKDFSEQQIVDCSRGYGNSGCLGGRVENTNRYLIAYGSASLADYPYRNNEGKCNFSKAMAAWYPKDFAFSWKGNETLLKRMVAEIGPVTASIPTPAELQLYGQGVFRFRDCNKFPVNHAVTVVGYGSEGGQDYWLVKNSWSTWWGEFGYMKIARNARNLCFIASSPSVALGYEL